MAKKSCKKGYYYCYASKKCKKIPMGYVVGMGGWLRKEREEEKSSDETEGKKKNGNGNGANGNGNGNGGSDGGSNGGGVSEAWSAKYKKSIDCDNPKGFSQRAHCRGRKMNEAKGGDHEVAMAQSQLKKSATNIAKLRKALGKKEKDIPAWMQAKITDTAHDTDAAAGYVDKMDEEVIAEKRDGKSSKDKGYSLRDWFKGGGWKQTGGKYDGKPCAKQPGQKTKPYCRDADDRAAMSKEERNKRAAKKRKEDPNPNRTGKARNVTQESYSSWRTEIELDEGAAHAIRLGLAAGTTIGGAILGKKAHDAIKGMTDRRNKKMDDAIKKARGVFNSYVPEGDTVSEGDYRYGSYSTGRQKMLDGSLKTPADIDSYIKSKKSGKKPPVQTDKAHYEPEGELVDEGKKDACYHKVKSRYSVWPSAYASGALVKCRKVGAKNWGNKTKKEGYEFSNWRDDFQAMEFESVDIIKAEPLKPTDGIGSRMLGEAKKCWKGYKKVGTQKLFGKTYNRCKKIKKEEVEIQEAIPLAGLAARVLPSVIGAAGRALPFIIAPETMKTIAIANAVGGVANAVAASKNKEAEKIKKEREEVQVVMQHFSDWRAEMDLQEAIPGYEKYNDAVAAAKKLTGRKKIDALKAAAELRPKTEKEVDQKIPESHELGEDWQKSNRKDGVDGMSQKSVDAYKRENPGSKLQTAVTGNPKKGSKDAKRRKSFCSRSKGQKDMHNIDCTKTPDKKICKARKRWKC